MDLPSPMFSLAQQSTAAAGDVADVDPDVAALEAGVGGLDLNAAAAVISLERSIKVTVHGHICVDSLVG